MSASSCWRPCSSPVSRSVGPLLGRTLPGVWGKVRCSAVQLPQAWAWTASRLVQLGWAVCEVPTNRNAGVLDVERSKVGCPPPGVTQTDAGSGARMALLVLLTSTAVSVMPLPQQFCACSAPRVGLRAHLLCCAPEHTMQQQQQPGTADNKHMVDKAFSTQSTLAPCAQPVPRHDRGVVPLISWPQLSSSLA